MKALHKVLSSSFQLKPASSLDGFINTFYFLVESDEVRGEDYLLIVTINRQNQVSIKKVFLSKDRTMALVHLSKEHPSLLYRLSFGHPREITIFEEEDTVRSSTHTGYQVAVSK